MAGVSRTKLFTAFAAVYLIWGSTYLAIKFAIDTMPPFLMAGVRFVIAGLLLYLVSRLRGAARPTFSHWKATALVGGLLLLGGNGGVVWAQQTVPSGVAALLVAIVACWMVLIDWLRPGGRPPTLPIALGLVLGLAGLVLLIGPDSIMGGGRVPLVGALVLAAASFSWATGSVVSQHIRMPDDGLLTTAMEMLCGGTLLVGASLVAGEPASFDPSSITVRSALAVVYLILVGSIVGYTAYIFLLRWTTPAKAATYAYVNPVVAVILGWAFAGEALTTRMLIAAVVIIGGVALITLGRARGEETPGTWS